MVEPNGSIEQVDALRALMQCADGPRTVLATAPDDTSIDAVLYALNGLARPDSTNRPAVLLVVDDHVTMRV
ncbi:hypothetical protein GR925_37565 [Streptomyces sp. HUCO-GS316]|uniref:hypothetical protein n=1 Tax=Streptomyces sp. HUCO-GS316 TaxID=2692198 RepID=UPI00136C499D|nr:hypothetical protein [Streptomyces sp. HUCO-GS316]MXM68951.1 hypothetical protein [Streptomyces sp. HUCO-GS316]